MPFNLNDLRQRMDGAINNLKEEFAGLRTGRAASSMLEPVTVEVYGSRMPLNQLATITAPEPRLLNVQVWDASQSKTVEKAIRDSGLGLNPIGEGAVIRVPIPELNQERRAELSKVASKYAEQTRIAVRNIRRDGMDTLKKLKSDGMPEDENKRHGDEIQKLTDDVIQKIDTMLKDKEKDIMTV